MSRWEIFRYCICVNSLGKTQKSCQLKNFPKNITFRKSSYIMTDDSLYSSHKHSLFILVLIKTWDNVQKLLVVLPYSILFRINEREFRSRTSFLNFSLAFSTTRIQRRPHWILLFAIPIRAHIAQWIHYIHFLRLQATCLHKRLKTWLMHF